MTYSDSDDESVCRPSSDDDDDDNGTEALAEMLERTRREQAAQREMEAEGTTDESQESTVLPAPVEPPAEGGFVGPPGHVYANPRDTPYAGTVWRGDRNMFGRINRDDLSKPKGTRPAGYIWNEELLGWRRTETHTILDEARLAAQARAKGAKALPFGLGVPDCTCRASTPAADIALDDSGTPIAWGGCKAVYECLCHVMVGINFYRLQRKEGAILVNLIVQEDCMQLRLCNKITPGQNQRAHSARSAHKPFKIRDKTQKTKVEVLSCVSGGVGDLRRLLAMRGSCGLLNII